MQSLYLSHGAGSLHFVTGKQEGWGFYTYPISGNSYEGEWKEGAPHGVGRYTWANGRVYEGQFVKNKKDGLGVHWDKKGVIRRCGLWHDNHFIKAQPVPRSALPAEIKHLTEAMRAAGPHILLLPGNAYYSGSINTAFQYHGEGTVFAANGRVRMHGAWDNDSLVRQLEPPQEAAAASSAPTFSAAVTSVPACSAAPASASSSSECIVCCDRPRDCLIDCVHFCLCFDCAVELQRCPICRTDITQRVQKRIVMS
jgi:hypothetical protein